jgi:plasmid stabilization system protein ParE
MKIVWTAPAVDDLRELHAYIARDSETYASGFVERIIIAAERLVQHPNVGGLSLRQVTNKFASFSFKNIELFIASRAIPLQSWP